MYWFCNPPVIAHIQPVIVNWFPIPNKNVYGNLYSMMLLHLCKSLTLLLGCSAPPLIVHQVNNAALRICFFEHVCCVSIVQYTLVNSNSAWQTNSSKLGKGLESPDYVKTFLSRLMLSRSGLLKLWVVTPFEVAKYNFGVTKQIAWTNQV